MRFSPRMAPLRSALAVVAFLSAVPSFPWGGFSRSPADDLPPVARTSETIADGVEYIHEYHTSGPLNIHVAKIDLSTTFLSVMPVLAKGRLFNGATVDEIARFHETPCQHVLVATNADFWKHSPALFTPVNLFVSDGLVARLPVVPAPRAVLGATTDGRLFMTPLRASLTVSAGQRRLRNVGLNDPTSSAGAVLYNRHYGRPVPLKEFHRAYELELPEGKLLPNEKVQARVVGAVETTSATVTGNKVILALRPKEAKRLGELRAGTSVNLHVAVPEIQAPIAWAIGGGPMLLRKGRIHIDWQQEKIVRSFVTTRHPRTAVGLTRDGKTLYLLTVDGRQPGLSVGMSLPELAEYLRQLGCWTAMNFDGGGSTTMVIRGDIVNKPSDRFGPRTVVNALLVTELGPVGDLRTVEILPRETLVRIPAGAKDQFSARGRDERGNPVPLEPSRVNWVASPEIGSVLSFGTTCTLTASSQPTTGFLTLRYSLDAEEQHRLETSKTVAVVKLTTLTVEPSPVVLAKGDSVYLDVKAYDPSGGVPLKPEQVAIRADDSAVTATLLRVRALQPGKGCLEVRVGNHVAIVPYFVDQLTTHVLCNFDETIKSHLSGAGFDRRKTRVRVDRRRPREGNGCLSWQYAMKRGGPSRIVLPVDFVIERRPAKLGVWIFGDGKEAWLRAMAVDAKGQQFLLDFTNGSEGITWNKKWQRAQITPRDFVPINAALSTKPSYPLRITELVLAQDQEALKAKGEILLDQFEVFYPLVTSDLPCPPGAN